MKTFNFYHKNLPMYMSISAETFRDAEVMLEEMIVDMYGWRCDNEEGEGEEDED